MVRLTVTLGGLPTDLLGPAALGRADMGPIPLGKAGHGDPRRSGGVYRDPHSSAQTSARYARWREGFTDTLKTAQPEFIECHGRHEAHPPSVRRGGLTTAERRSPSAPNPKGCP